MLNIETFLPFHAKIDSQPFKPNSTFSITYAGNNLYIFRSQGHNFSLSSKIEVYLYWQHGIIT